jgi:hypothetical protein
MSAIFIIKYSGQPLRVPDMTLVPAREATQFTSEADAWRAAHENHLAPELCRVVPLDEALKADGVEPVPTKEAA